MGKTFLFYDLETSGLSKCFDQVLQFAAIRTDQSLQEIERHTFNIKLNPDVIPSPQALITHQIPFLQLLQGEPEFEVMEKIHALLNTPNTISIGYNNLKFDDEFLRFSFYRNLLPPYTHQYANGCGRMDLYPMIIMYYLFKNEILKWPLLDEKVSFKLEQLGIANQLNHGPAHTAIVDVEMTLALARILKKENKMWDYLSGYFDKNTNLTRIAELKGPSNFGKAKIALLIDGIYGSENKFMRPVLFLGTHYHYKNQTIWLELDNINFIDLKAENITELPNIYRKKIGEIGLLLPFERRFNQLSESRLNLLEQNLLWLANNPQLLKEIAEYHLDYTYPYIPNLDIDAALYQNSFWSDYEISCGQNFRKANFSEKIKWLEKFPSQNLKTQALRILGRNYYSNLTDDLKKAFAHHLKTIWTDKETEAAVDYRNFPRLSLVNALAEIESLNQQNLSNAQNEILISLKQYISNNLIIT
jgi:exodeoxyribonuclease I